MPDIDGLFLGETTTPRRWDGRRLINLDASVITLGTLATARYPDALLLDGSRYMTGNLGITLTPTARLTIAGSSVDDSDIRLYDDDKTTLKGSIYVQKAGEDFIIEAKRQNLNFNAQTSTPLRLFSQVTGGISSVAPFAFNVTSSTRNFLGFFADWGGGTPPYRARGTKAAIIECVDDKLLFAKDSGLTPLSLYNPTWILKLYDDKTLEPQGNIRMLDDKYIIVGKDSDGTLPTADSTYRGKMIRVEGGAGIADKLYICMKSATDTYSWVQIASG